MKTPSKSLRRLPRLATVAAGAALACAGARAVELPVGNPDLKLRWDNTVKYSSAWRLKDADPVLLANPNLDDGDRNFAKGLVSSRFDLLSEADLTYKKSMGLRVSAAAWYDQVYNQANDNPGFAGGAFPNHAVVPGVQANEFTPATRDLHGRKAEVLDAFVFGKFDLGESTASVRLGKHTLLWGESLFFGANAIAGAQAPVDVIKATSVPGSQFKEFILPVPQVSAQVQINRDIAVGAYYQFRFKPNRLPAVGSYFSVSDTLQDGAERILLPTGAAERTADARAKNSGQGGLSLRIRAAETDFGLYAIRFHAKTPQVVARLGPAPAPFGVLPASYYLAYHESITAFGASASRTVGNFNLAAEASVRRNQDLASQAIDTSGLGGPGTDNVDNPGYATGKTAHINLSTLATLGSNPLWNEATLLAEVAWNRVLSVTKNAGAVDPNSTRDAWALRAVLEPTYRQVLSGLDLGVPIGLGYAPSSSRSRVLGPGALPAAGGGDLSLGLNGTYLELWKFSLAWTHYFGPANPAVVTNPANPAASMYSFQQSTRDRDFLAFSLSTTF